MKGLQNLSVGYARVSDTGIPLEDLQWINLYNTQVSDLSPLAELKNLKWLTLNATPVEDISPLAQLGNLELLYLQYSQVSEEQVQAMRKALPNREIEHSIRVEAPPATS